MIIDDEITVLGKCNFRNQKVNYGIKKDDRRRHIYIIGKTGVGKTTLMENMIIDDIRAGRGVALVDPHGDFAEKILHFIPEDRIDDTIYFNPADSDNPVAFNPLETVAGEDYHLIASGIMAVFEKIWPDVWSARMQYILNNTLLALLEFPNATLPGIMRMMSDKKFRQEVVGELKDPVVKGFWVNEFANYTDRLATEAVAAIQNKVGQFVANPLIRNVIGQARSSINLREIMDERKILIVNVSKGRIGEDNSALLGAMMITRIQLAAMSRVNIESEEARKDFYLYIDEFQNFSTESFASILSEARKYRLNLTLAHQYIAQLVGDNTKVRDAIFGNVGTFITFRVGAEDADFLEPEFAPTFEAGDLVNLPKFSVYIKLMIDGIAGRPFSAGSLPPYKKTDESFADVIIDNSRRLYSTPKEKVEQKIRDEWAMGEGHAVRKKVERKIEKGLEVLEKPPQRERKPKPSIDRGRLRDAIEKELTKESVSLDISRDSTLDPNYFRNVGGVFVQVGKGQGKPAGYTKECLQTLNDEFEVTVDGIRQAGKQGESIVDIMGSYLGEVLVKNLGGSWEFSPTQNRWVVVLTTKEGDKMESNVFRKVENRIKNGKEDSFTYFYDMTEKLVNEGHDAILGGQIEK